MSFVKKYRGGGACVLQRTNSVGNSLGPSMATWQHGLMAAAVLVASMLAVNAQPFLHRHMLSELPSSHSTEDSLGEAEVSELSALPAIIARNEASSAARQWEILINASSLSAPRGIGADKQQLPHPSPERLFGPSHNIYIPPEIAERVEEERKKRGEGGEGKEEAIKKAIEGQQEAPQGIRNTTVADPREIEEFWGADDHRKEGATGEYNFKGDGSNTNEKDNDGKEHLMKQLAQNAYSGRRGKGWKVEEHSPSPPSAFSWLRDISQLEIDGMVQMITARGYPSETHKCVTRDGHHLVNFRIKHGSDGPSGTSKRGKGVDRQPILLIHGISLSSTSWVVNGPSESLGFILADEGYDVWMMNTRGNTFSREHEDYDNSDPRFWAWSLDQLALEDLPAVVAYVLGVTGAEKVPLIGHSQGGTIALAALSELPRMNAAISLLIGLAPVVYTKYMTAPVLVQFSRRANDSILYDLLPPQEWFFMSETAHNIFLNNLCQLPPSIPGCLVATTQMFGTSDHISILQYRRMWQQWPSPTSYYNVLQWAQMFNEPEPRFMKFNYGPEYNLTKINVPTFYISGGRDVLAGKQDVEKAKEELTKGGALVGEHHVEGYSHMDWIWNVQAGKDLHTPVLDALDKYIDLEEQ